MKKEEKSEKVLNFFKKNKHNILVIIIIMAIIITIIIYKKYLNEKITYTVSNGYVEISSSTQASILTEETVVPLNNTQVAVSLVEQNKRVAKNQMIAMYKNEEYDQYISTISELDKAIETLIVDLPATYSNEVENIDAQIRETAKLLKGETSYLKMQEYKNKLDELAYKKIIILGDLSPDGSKVRELIEERETVEKNAMASSESSILAPESGVVTYKIDGLENMLDIQTILECDTTKLDEIMEKYKASNNSNFGIKVVDNFNAYILIIQDQDDLYDPYIEVGEEYELKVLDNDIDSFTGEIVRAENKNDKKYIIFKIQNGIESICDLRTMDIEIVWKKISGMTIPKEAIHKNIEKNYDYVTLVYGSQYVEVPIEIVIEKDGFCVVENVENSIKEQLGLSTYFILENYDKIVIE